MIEALNDKVLIRPIIEEKKESVIAVVEVRKDTLLKGVVVNVGDAVLDEFKVGDTVYYSAYGYEEVGEYVLTTDDMIYARISAAN